MLAGLLGTVPVFAQTLSNKDLKGNFYFRHVSLGTDGVNPGNLTDARSLFGSITFDGSGNYTYIGQQLTGINAAVSQTGKGTYSLDPGGFLSLDSPLRASAKINARFGPEAIIGSSTESADNTYDLFVAIPAPASGAIFNGPYNCMSSGISRRLHRQHAEHPVPPQPVRRLGNLKPFSVSGHAASISLGRPVTQQMPAGAGTYTMGDNGQGSSQRGHPQQCAVAQRQPHPLPFGLRQHPPGRFRRCRRARHSDRREARLWRHKRYLERHLLGRGTARGCHAVSGYSGALSAGGKGKLTWTKRFKALGAGAFDYTGTNSYALTADGTGTVDLTQITVGVAGKAFAGAAINPTDPAAYEIYFGVQTPSLSGTGVFLNPLGVINAASFAPPGNPISPGQFVTLFGTGLAKSNQTATPPYPLTLNGVSVLINNKPAPLYFVSPGQLNVLVPFATTGPTATIVVQNGSVNSNTVTVPVAATSPGIYSLDQSGSGAGAILHADYSLVNAAKPATGGETVLVYLTGLGTVTPAVADGTAGDRHRAPHLGRECGGLRGRPAGNGRFQGPGPRISGLVPTQRNLAATSENLRQSAPGDPDAECLSRSGGHRDSLKQFCADAGCSDPSRDREKPRRSTDEPSDERR